MRKPRCALPMISLALSSSGIILLGQTFTVATSCAIYRHRFSH
jgi:hypothetical protein